MLQRFFLKRCKCFRAVSKRCHCCRSFENAANVAGNLKSFANVAETLKMLWSFNKVANESLQNLRNLPEPKMWGSL